ncbi:MAG: chorismate-binding protein, partial [Pseudomonadota bacterium]
MNDRVQNSIFRQPRAIDLLQQYRPGVTFFGTPRATLLTYGVKAAVPLCAVQNLAAAATALLGEAEREGDLWPILIGAIPFGADAPARLFIPQQVLIGLGVKEQRGAIQPAPKPDSKPAPGAVQMRPTPDQYRHNVSRALSKIDAAAIEKVVLSRSLSLQGQVDLPALLQGLVGRNPLAYSFAIDLVDALPDAPAERRTLIGASPELLLARYGREVVSHPLAGSIPRSADAQEDRRRADALLCSHKDLREHALVVDAVAATLRPYCSTLSVPSAPTLLATPTMWHLGTEVRGELADPSVTSLQLALALHPTPAVCGHPTTAAKEFI